MIRYLRLALVIFGCIAILAGCGNRDPYQRNDVWYPTGMNAANLAVQVANPSDLVMGHGDTKQFAAAPAKGVSRVLNDTPKSLSPTPTGASGSGAGGSPTGSGGSGVTDVPTLPTPPTGG